MSSSPIEPPNNVNPIVRTQNGRGAGKTAHRIGQSETASKSQQLEHIRTQIANGTFTVDTGKLARSLIGNGLFRQP